MKKRWMGVIYLPPLPGYPNSPGLEAIIQSALEDASALKSAGWDGVLIENENDRPHRLKATPEVISAMTCVASAVRREIAIDVGVEVLLNDPIASLAIAHASGARFIRTDYFVDRMRRDEWGEMEIDPQGWMNYRRSIGADSVGVLADLQVKLAQLVVPKRIGDSAREAMAAGAWGLVVTGRETGEAPRVSDLLEVRESVGDFPIWVGSGLNRTNARELKARVDGALVGTGIMKEGRIDREKACRLAEILQGD